MKKFLLFWAALFFIHFAQAQILQQYNFTGAAGNETTFSPDGQPENGVLSNIKRGTGIAPSPGGGSFSAVNFTLDTQVDTSEYFDFGMAANTSFFLSLDSIVVGERRSNTGIRKFSVRSSLDNFSNDLQVFDVPDSASFRYNQKVSLGDNFKNIAGGTAVHFRYYGFQAESNAGTWRLDSIRVYGVITNFPLAVQSPKEQATIQISPNPGVDFLTVENPGQDPLPVYIFSSQGKLMTLENTLTARTIIETKSWPSGIYFIRVGNRNQRWIKR